MTDDIHNDILKAADEAVKERSEPYGHPWYDFTRTARLWEVVIGKPLKPEQVALMMALVKVARICNHDDFHHLDSVIDLAGYTACLQECHEMRERIENTRPEGEGDCF